MNRRRREEIMASDYARNMFRDGHNRAERNPKIRRAPDYDHAAHDYVEQTESLGRESFRRDTFHSRDGTDASGIFDESGGPIGGTEQELDDLEAGYTPVDRNPRMKDRY